MMNQNEFAYIQYQIYITMAINVILRLIYL